VEDSQLATRPSLLVVAVQWDVVACEGERSLSFTGMEVAGRPETVSRTWVVMKGRSAMVGGVLGWRVGGGGWRWDARSVSLLGAVFGFVVIG